MRETRIQSLGREDTLEEEMSTHSSILAWKIPWMEKHGAGYSSWGHKESDTTEWLHFNQSRRIDAFELWCWRRLLGPLNSREIKPVSPKGTVLNNPDCSVLNNHWKGWCWSWSSNTSDTWCKEPTHWKRPWCWERWRQKEKGAAEDEMVRYHHRLNGRELEQTPGDRIEQKSLVCCSPWGHKELDET